MMFTLVLFAILGLIVFAVTYASIQNEHVKENLRMAIEELEALEKHGIRYHYTPTENERLAYLKAYIEETTPKPPRQASAASAAFTLGVAAYTLYQNDKDNEQRYSRDLRRR